MKSIAQRPFVNLLGAIAGLLVSTASAQNAPDTKIENTIVLSPFSVHSEKDNGFVAASSLAGGRISTALKDTPVAYSVVTAEFLEAFNLTDVLKAAEWTVNSSVVNGDGSNQVFGASPSNSGVRTRGTATGTTTRNFFPFVFTADSYILDRVDFARGPNAVLFGAGSIGGTMNSVTKQALTTRSINEARLQLGSYNLRRFTFDINRPLNDKIALRVNAVAQQTDTWRENEWKERTGVHLAATWKITPKLTLRAEGEHGKIAQNTALSAWQDGLSGWDGTTSFTSIPTTALTASVAAKAGLTRITTNKWVESPGFGGQLLNFQNTYQTKALSQNNDVTLSGDVNGVPIRTVGWFLSNQSMIDINYGISQTDRYAGAVRGGKFSVPTRESNSAWKGRQPSYEEEGKDFSLSLDFNPTNKLFFQVTGNLNRSHILGNTAGRRGLPDMRIDTLQNLPNGALNPNFKRPYVDFYEFYNQKDANYRNLRAQAVYVENTRIGKFQFSLMGGLTYIESPETHPTLMLPVTTLTPDGRGWLNDQASYAYYKRQYIGDDRTYAGPNTTQPVTLFNPLTGTSATVTPRMMMQDRTFGTRNLNFFQTAGNLDLFKNKLILIGAFRRDFAFIETKRSFIVGDMPAGWNGVFNEGDYRPKAPKDYFNLMFTPKNAAGVATGAPIPADARPRATANGISSGQPQYAGDRFRDDYSGPSISPNINTFTTGAVYNVTPWLGVYGNISDSFDLLLALNKLDNSLLPPTTSRGKDYGLRVTLPNGRMSLSLGRYTSFREGESNINPGGFNGTYNFIYQAPVIGDLTSTGRNKRDAADFPINVYDTVTTDASGYELELTANFTRNWRLILNGAKSKAFTHNQNPDIIAFFKREDTRARQILADAGVLIDSANRASINPALNDPTLINQGRVTNAVNAWNNLQISTIPNLSAQLPQLALGSAEYVGNIATDYRLSSGPLKGLRLGAGINYRGGQVVGYRGSDTIRDPSDATKAVDDPTVDSGTAIIAPSYYKTVASMSYTFKFQKGRSLQFDLNIDNVLNRREPVFGSSNAASGTGVTILVPRNGLTNPERVTVPGNIFYLIPRNYTLSAKYNF